MGEVRKLFMRQGLVLGTAVIIREACHVTALYISSSSRSLPTQFTYPRARDSTSRSDPPAGATPA
jgi:hypothetical protein